MIGSLLFDIPPEPVSSVGIGVLIVLAIVVLAIVAVLIGGLVFLLIWHKRRNATASVSSAVAIPESSGRL